LLFSGRHETFGHFGHLTAGQIKQKAADRPITQRKRTIMERKALKGALLAAAIGAMFLTGPVFAQESSGSMAQANVKCLGGNSCKGQSACKGGNHSCKGQNSCKGQGFVMTSTAQDCTAKGGHSDDSK
jgi:hypothetical protein